LGAALGSAWGCLPLPGAGATMTSSSGAVDDAPPAVAEALLLFALAFAAAGVAETLLLFALAFAVGGCAEGSRLAALAFAAGGSDAARGGARGTDAGVGASFVAGAGAVVGVFIEAITFLSSAFCALRFNCASFRSGFLILTGNLSSRPACSFPLSGCPPGICVGPFGGGGAMPLAGSPGPLTSISAKSLGLVILDIRVWRAFSAIFLMRVSFVE